MTIYSPIYLHKATKFIPSKHEKKIEGAWIEQKIDGVSCQVIFNPGTIKAFANKPAEKANAFSEFTNKVPHIIDELSKFDFEGILQGELYADHLPTDQANFKYTNGVLKAKDSYQRQCKTGLLKFIIYDMPSHPGAYKHRYEALDSIFKRNPGLQYVSLIPIIDINYTGGWIEHFNRLVSQGREGVVLYNQDSLYKHSDVDNQRNPGIWKIKAQDAKEVCAIEKIEGNEGKHHGSLGALICIDGKGKKFRIGSFQLTDAERLYIWNDVKVPFILEMRYAQETNDSYRHSIMTRLRTDKLVEDWNKNDL